jgi:putative oxidoreductase
MDLLRAIARPMLSGMFVYGGLDSMRAPHTKVPQAEPVVARVAERLNLPGDTATWVRVNGVVQVLAGTALATGRLPRLAALTLAASLVPTTLAGHRFWDEAEDGARARQRIQFLKNLSMLGGLMLAADDTGGRPSIPWRMHRATNRALDHVPMINAG